MTGTKPPAGAKGGPKKRQQLLVWSAIGVVTVGLCAVGALTGDSDTAVPAPAADERADTVPLLASAAASQRICYGWRLTDGYDVVSVGSNVADGTGVGDAPGCPRWLEVYADVTYTAESSEANDSATIRVNSSEDLELADLYRIEAGLARFGLDESTFVDDPGWAVTRAATVLPLLAVEVGLAEPAAVPTAGPTAVVRPLPAAGSDFWRDRWLWLLATAGLLVLAALFVTVGVRQRRGQLRARVPAQRAGAGAATRTRDTA